MATDSRGRARQHLAIRARIAACFIFIAASFSTMRALTSMIFSTSIEAIGLERVAGSFDEVHDEVGRR